VLFDGIGVNVCGGPSKTMLMHGYGEEIVKTWNGLLASCFSMIVMATLTGCGAGAEDAPQDGAESAQGSQTVGTSQDSLTGGTYGTYAGQLSYSEQYLQLQNQMENENRAFTAVSNIMKAKHDTVKNSISNIR
jgi:hypothetical protein